MIYRSCFVLVVAVLLGCSNNDPPSPQTDPLYVSVVGNDPWEMTGERYAGVDTVGEWRYLYGEMMGDTFVEIDTLVWYEWRVARWEPDTLEVPIPVEISWYNLVAYTLMFRQVYRPFPYYRDDGSADTLRWYDVLKPNGWRTQ